MSQINRCKCLFARCERGNIAILFGLSLTVLSLIIGIAYDTSRVFSANSALQAALDAAALAGAKTLQVGVATDSDVQLAVTAYFNTYLPDIKVDYRRMSALRIGIDRNNSAVSAGVDIEFNSLFGGLAGMSPTLTASPSSRVVFKANRLEIALVLDITGSMDQVPSGGGPRKIDGLKQVAPSFVDSLYAAAPLPGGVRVGLVPFSASVNVGNTYQAATNFTPPSGCDHNCSPPDSCVVERAGTYAYSEAAPGPGGYSGIGPAGNGRYVCPSARMQPLTDLLDPTARTAFEAQINALQAGGGTAGHVGLAWGWYLLSDQWGSIFGSSAGRTYTTDGTLTKAVVLMTDGAFNTSYFNGTQNSLDPTATGSSLYQATQLCQGLAARGVKVFTVGFDITGDPQYTDAHNFLANCAANSGGQYYQPNNAAALNAAFQDVVHRLSNLRVAAQ